MNTLARIFAIGISAGSLDVALAAELPTGARCEKLEASSIEVKVFDSLKPFRVTVTNTGAHVEALRAPAPLPRVAADLDSNFYTTTARGCTRMDSGADWLCPPRLTSPNREVELSAAYHSDSTDTSLFPFGVFVVRKADQTGKVIPLRSMGRATFIETFGWKPDSAEFAMVISQEAEFRDSLKALVSPHPARVKTMQLVVYSADGDLLCSVPIAKQIASGVPRIRWQ